MKYSALICCFALVLLACTKDENTEISPVSHIDWEPDLVITDSFSIDINGDDIMDLDLHSGHFGIGSNPDGSTIYQYWASVSRGNLDARISLGISDSPDFNWNWDCIEDDKFIDESLTWRVGSDIRIEEDGMLDSGIWDRNSHHGYIGMKLETDDSTIYGWLRLEVESDSSLPDHYKFILKEYATMEAKGGILEAGQIE